MCGPIGEESGASPRYRGVQIESITFSWCTKAQALAGLGEQNAGIRLVQEWLREASA